MSNISLRGRNKLYRIYLYLKDSYHKEMKRDNPDEIRIFGLLDAWIIVGDKYAST